MLVEWSHDEWFNEDICGGMKQPSLSHIPTIEDNSVKFYCVNYKINILCEPVSNASLSSVF